MNGEPRDRQAILKRALEEIKDLRARADAAERAAHEPVAVVGMAGRLPGAADLDAFWRLLRDGGDAIVEIPPDRWDAAAYYDPTPGAAGKMNTRWGGFLEDIDAFDAEFFRISPREAISMDPQQRLLLEVAWEALENAAHASRKGEDTEGGVFVGISTNDYAARLIFGDPRRIDIYSATGNALNIAAGRIAYVLGLNGPALAVDTACSSSLVAVHLACRSLRAGECRFALAGGVNVILSPNGTISTSRAGMMARDGRCKTFDARADGYVRSEGCALVVLKRLSDALADGDAIVALIRGSAVNQDGASSALTVPNGRAQRALIRAALADARLAPADLDYVEAHGTGTALGDPIEVDALTEVLAEGRPRDRRCAIGSVKTNVGHLESAAGIAGLVKTLLALRHEQIPPHVHLRELNPQIRLEPPFVVPASGLAWPRGERPRRAGVSSFGFSGTNAHAVVEEAPLPAPAAPAPDRPLHLVALSARSETALAATASRLREALERAPGLAPADVAFSANAGRSHFEHRLAFVAGTAAELRAQLAAAAGPAPARGTWRGRAAVPRPRVAFAFRGGRAEIVRELCGTQPLVRRIVDRCEGVLREAGAPAWDAHPRTASFVAGYAAAQLWRSWGVEPWAVAAGEDGALAADCVAGALPLEEALRRTVSGEGRPDPARNGAPRLRRLTLEELAREPGVTLEPGRDGWAGLLAALAELYAGGAEIDWAGFDRGYARRRVALPAYPFERGRYWHPAAAPAERRGTGSAASVPHPFVRERIRSPLAAHLFGAEYALETLPLVADHRILGMAWVNLATYLESAAAAARAAFGTGELRLTEVRVPHGLVLGEDETRPAQIVLTPDDGGGAAFGVFSLAERTDAAPAWTAHAEGRIAPLVPDGAGAESREHVDLASLRTACPAALEPHDVYAAMERHGVALGPACRWLAEIGLGERSALARVRAARPGELAGDYVLHLGALDASFQLLAVLLPPDAPRDYLLAGLDELAWYGGTADETLWSHAVLAGWDPATQTLRGDVTLSTAGGRVVATLRGARLERVGTQARSAPAPDGEPGRPRLTLAELAELGAAERRARATRYLAEELAHSKGVPPDAVDTRTGLRDQLDSLMAVELKTRIEAQLGVEVPVAAFFDGSTPEDLAAALLDALDARVAAARAGEDEGLAELVEAIAGLSDEEARRLLAVE
jgi:acyl transferase domain-containing protein